MFIKQTCKKLKGKTYSNYLLVESVATGESTPENVIAMKSGTTPGPMAKSRKEMSRHHLLSDNKETLSQQ